MKDQRVEQLAHSIIDYSVSLKKGEKILIEVLNSDGIPLAKELIRYVYAKGGIPFTIMQNDQLEKELLAGYEKEQISLIANSDLVLMKEAQAYVRIRSIENVNEFAGCNPDKMVMVSKYYYQPVHIEQRIKHTKWCVLRYPSPALAQLANVSTDDFEDFYFNVCNMDYRKMSKAMDGLGSLLKQTETVKIKGKNTDLSFSTKGISIIKGDGRVNIPDGELYTAPIKNSVNGVVAFNVATLYDGMEFENIVLEFKDGNVVKATANDTEKLNKVLDTDEGARYLGEFAFGVNPYMKKPMKDILFDEKIGGSFHLALGNCYDEAFNDNHSAIHWDLIQIQTPEYGGGEIWFDNKLVRKDGLFVVKELECLNPEDLK